MCVKTVSPSVPPSIVKRVSFRRQERKKERKKCLFVTLNYSSETAAAAAARKLQSPPSIRKGGRPINDTLIIFALGKLFRFARINDKLASFL